ncbi:acyloxyacyl hydrolase [Candidatus Pelagibacter bacterium]|nr:acyloxyacyl hydrolase [Candidatus Pelagibacter bacterium]
MNLKIFRVLTILVILSSQVIADDSNKELSFYTGTFDVIDKEGDDKTTLFGIEHKNPDLFRDTLLGKFKPVSGAFITGNSSVYLYTGIEGQYGLGPLKILPSFTPGYYEKGDGKDLGSVLEFKSEIKFGLDIFENSKLSYSYSHISNNDWGDTNPGTDNQQITFSKNF